MSPTYICNNPDHPVHNHPKEYSANTLNGFCPDCPFGAGILVEPSGPVINDVGLCILVCDASESMHERAFPGVPGRKIDLVIRSVVQIIAGQRNYSRPEHRFVALIGFSDHPTLLRDPKDRPFIKSIAEINETFPTDRDLADFIRAQLVPAHVDAGGEIVARSFTDITSALMLAHRVYQGALRGDLSQFGLETRFTLMEHHPISIRDRRQYTIPNVRTLLLSDGGHHPPDRSPLVNPFEHDVGDNGISVLSTFFFGDGAEPGAALMRALASVCPIHEHKGYFLFNNAHRVHKLSRFMRNDATSSVCPICFAEASKEWTNSGTFETVPNQPTIHKYNKGESTMSLVYICNNPDHPVQKHSKKYPVNTQDGFCPDCPFGEGILIGIEEKDSGGSGATPSLVIDGVGLCILVCDASGSMTEPAFPNSKPTKIDMGVIAVISQ